MIVLNEPLSNADLGHVAFVVAFQEEAAVVAEDLGFDQQYSREAGIDFLHPTQNTRSFNICRR